jgi:hypothetical protein
MYLQRSITFVETFSLKSPPNVVFMLATKRTFQKKCAIDYFI